MELFALIELKIYTDGGCHGNPGPGGWAYRVVDGDNALVSLDAGFAAATTNNRMELTAVIAALRSVRSLDHGHSFVVVTDSEYVRKGITEWIERWRLNGWRTTAKKPVKNEDLWKTLDALARETGPRWEWVKGHAGDEHNEACDRAVQEQILLGTQAGR
ncbi:MAG: ribonuclease HI [Spirochaetaceae bacterium]|nr:MAG: ribonuclease HI [Spirochaetaceae bacterium]